MLKPCSFHDSTKEYLTVYYEILNTMIQEMEQVRLTDSISRNFILQMIPHHRAAIRMSENLLKYAVCDPLQEIASGIIAEQTQSIRDMRHALECCQKYHNSRQDLQLYQHHFRIVTRTMFQKMDTASATNNIADTFMREMIPHHEGAVHMSENALRYCVCPELVPILNAIITSQTEGIQKMQQLLSEQICRQSCRPQLSDNAMFWTGMK